MPLLAASLASSLAILGPFQTALAQTDAPTPTSTPTPASPTPIPGSPSPVPASPSPIPASPTPVPTPLTHIPPDFRLIDAALGVQLYRKDYANGSPDFVQVIDLEPGHAG